MYKVSVLTIGDEICIGQIINSNAAWIASRATYLGAEIVKHSSVRDIADDIQNELSQLLDISDCVIITGGLGPTHDDISKSVLADFFDDELVFNQESYDNILELLSSRGIKPNPIVKQMAMLPKSCKPLSNGVGTAPGMLFETNGKIIISLPGVPMEMKYILEHSVLPVIKDEIKNRNDDVLLYKTLQTTGIPESVLSQKIGDIEQFIGDGSLAYLPSYSGVRLRIGVKGESFAICGKKLSDIEAFIRTKANDYIYGEENVSLPQVVGELLVNLGRTVAVAESCTGGLLGGEFTSVPGSSQYFLGGVITYSNSAKEEVLGVAHDTLVRNGAVSGETAEEMAAKARELFSSDFALSITGIAGPGGGTQDKPVGTVWIALADNKKVKSYKYNFGNERIINRERAVNTALNLLYNKLKKIY